MPKKLLTSEENAAAAEAIKDVEEKMDALLMIINGKVKAKHLDRFLHICRLLNIFRSGLDDEVVGPSSYYGRRIQ